MRFEFRSLGMPACMCLRAPQAACKHSPLVGPAWLPEWPGRERPAAPPLAAPASAAAAAVQAAAAALRYHPRRHRLQRLRPQGLAGRQRWLARAQPAAQLRWQSHPRAAQSALTLPACHGCRCHCLRCHWYAAGQLRLPTAHQLPWPSGRCPRCHCRHCRCRRRAGCPRCRCRQKQGCHHCPGRRCLARRCHCHCRMGCCLSRSGSRAVAGGWQFLGGWSHCHCR
jgi:hypothetical protein